MPPVRVDRCVCTGLSFEQLRELSREHGDTLERLAQRTGATADCGMCRPYVKRCLLTGRTVFHELLGDEGEEGPDAGSAA